MLDLNDAFDIGAKNYRVARKVLWKNGLLVSAEDVGGTIPRTVHLDMTTGTVMVFSQGNAREL